MEATPLTRNARIGRRTAAVTAVAFVLLLALPPLDQLKVEVGAGSRWKFAALFREFPSPRSLRQFEEDLAADSRLGREARTAYQSLLTGLFRAGNGKIVVGQEGYLFFRKEVDLATGPGLLEAHAAVRRGSGEDREGPGTRDPVGAIADYHRQLKGRGIDLVFVPLPSKPSIYPEKLWAGYPLAAGAACNRDWQAFLSRLRAQGVDVLDVTEDLWRAKPSGELFLRRDTHWTPFGMEIAASRIAERLRPSLGPARETYAWAFRPVEHDGDLLRMIDLAPGSILRALQSVQIREVAGKGGDEAPVLLLGDSFTNIYSRRELSWGERAGLGEQLMRLLGLPVQILALNGGGATAVRELLARRPAALKRKRVVVWACSSRDLGDPGISWESVPLPDASP